MNLKEIRNFKGFTQKAVADYLGCSAVVYSRYETGDREPSIDTLIRLADCFCVSVDYLLGRQNTESSGLSSYEIALIAAARSADERARQDALNMLTAHLVESKKENLA
jgi:transcriptional regulator with XRE-family HTH domain